LRPSEKNPRNSVFLLPTGVYTPYNAQATLHFRRAFYALYLPVTVAGRVSDIWRAYVSQALFSLTSTRLAFLPRPLVTQARNPHSNEADFSAEIPLYRQSLQLVEFLSEWASEAREA
jgi:hypothetical protein